MKFLTDRHDVAMALNFGKYPVLHIDLQNEMPGYKDCFEGCRVMVAPSANSPRNDMIRCTLKKFSDEKTYSLMPESVFLSSSFGYSDVMEEAAWANAPVIHEGETVVVIEDFPREKTCRVHLMTVTHPVKWVFPTCKLAEIDG